MSSQNIQPCVKNRIPTPLQAMRAVQLLKDYMRECGSYEAVMPPADWVTKVADLLETAEAPSAVQIYRSHELSLGECQQLYSASLPCSLNTIHPVSRIFLDTSDAAAADQAARRWYADPEMRRCPTCGHASGLVNLKLTQGGV